MGDLLCSLLYIRGVTVARASVHKPRRGLIGGKSLFNFKGNFSPSRMSAERGCSLVPCNDSFRLMTLKPFLVELWQLKSDRND